MKTNGAKTTKNVTEQSGEGVRITQGVIRFLNLFLPVTLAKRAAAMILIATGVSDERVTGLTGLCDGSVRALRKALREGEPLQCCPSKRGAEEKAGQPMWNRKFSRSWREAIIIPVNKSPI